MEHLYYIKILNNERRSFTFTKSQTFLIKTVSTTTPRIVQTQEEQRT